MAGIGVTVDASGLDAVIAAFEQLSEGEFESLMTQVGNTLVSQTHRHFDDQSGPFGGWEPLAPATIRGGRDPGSILVDTGALRSSITADVDDMEVEVGTSVEYGVYHQQGTSRMPARPFIGMSNDDESELEEVVAAFLVSKMGG